MMRMNKIFSVLSVLQILVLAGALLLPSFVQASSYILENKAITVEVGKTFTIPVTITPAAGEKNYTAKLALDYSPSVLEVVSFNFKPTWLPVTQPGYDSVDNDRGEMIKTAGFPRGFSSPVSFGTVTFRAKTVGEDVISVSPRSLVLNASNKDTLQDRSQARVTIIKASAASTGTLSAPPEQTNLFDVSQEAPQVQTTGEGLASKVAPGEPLTFSVKLLNFGSNKKVDVSLIHNVSDMDGKVIYHTEETVAVETTASFVKTLQIPADTPPGRYVVKSYITYKGQVAPAQAQFPFTVERKIFGLFQSDFWLYGGTTATISVLAVFGYTLFRRYNQTRFAPFSYANISGDSRIFYEILSDTIMGMRQRVGNSALLIASKIDGLKIDPNSGRVLSVGDNPSKIIATLVAEYENLLGKKVSFSFRQTQAII